MIALENAPGQCTKFELRAKFSGGIEGQGTAGGAAEEESVVPGHAAPPGAGAAGTRRMPVGRPKPPYFTNSRRFFLSRCQKSFTLSYKCIETE